MYSIQVNSRVFVDYALKYYVGLDEVEASTIRRLIDRKDKMPAAEFVAAAEAAVKPSHRDSGALDKLFALLKVRSIEELDPELQKVSSLLPIRELMSMLARAGITNAVFDPSLMRGFDYYTDIVFEVFDTDPENNRSMFGGGRYDGLVAMFGVPPVATVGFGMGDVALENFLRSHGLAKEPPVETDLYVALAGDVYKDAQKIIKYLRSEGVKVAVDMTGRKIGKQIETAVKKGIRYAIVIGEEEVETEQLKLKDLQESREEPHSLERIISLCMRKRSV